MGLVPVPFAGPGLVTVPGFGVHRRYGPISGHTPRYPPSAFPVGIRFHILARNHSQQTYCVGLFGVQLYVLHPFDQRQPVGDQTVDQFRSAVGIRPVTGRFRLRFVVMGHQHQVGCLRDQTSATPYLRRDHRHRVPGSNRVVQNGRVQRTASPVRQHPTGGDHLPHRVEDTLRTVTRPKPRSPQRQHRRVEPPIGQRQTSRRFPSYVTTQPLDRFPIRQALQRLEDHHRPNHRARYRRAAPRAEQIPKHLSGKQTPAVLSQKLIHRTLRNQLPTQFHSVQKLTITTFTTLHTTYNNPNKPKTRTSQHPTDRLNQQSPSNPIPQLAPKPPTRPVTDLTTVGASLEWG